MKKSLIIKCGSSIPELVEQKGDFEDWIIDGAGLRRDQTLIVNVENDEPLPEIDEISGAIVTGSHAMVTDHLGWSEKTSIWLRLAHGNVPLLGICYGHQLLGYALGGKVADSPSGREMGSVKINFHESAEDDPLFGELPASIVAQVSHKQSLIELPPDAILLAHSAEEQHQAFRVGEASWGVQFHPEFDAGISKSYIDFCADLLRAEGQNPEALRLTCRDSEAGSQILQKFSSLLS